MTNSTNMIKSFIELNGNLTKQDSLKYYMFLLNKYLFNNNFYNPIKHINLIDQFNIDYIKNNDLIDMIINSNYSDKNKEAIINEVINIISYKDKDIAVDFAMNLLDTIDIKKYNVKNNMIESLIYQYDNKNKKKIFKLIDQELLLDNEKKLYNKLLLIDDNISLLNIDKVYNNNNLNYILTNYIKNDYLINSFYDYMKDQEKKFTIQNSLIIQYHLIKYYKGDNYNDVLKNIINYKKNNKDAEDILINYFSKNINNENIFVQYDILKDNKILNKNVNNKIFEDLISNKIDDNKFISAIERIGLDNEFIYHNKNNYKEILIKYENIKKEKLKVNLYTQSYIQCDKLIMLYMENINEKDMTSYINETKWFLIKNKEIKNKVVNIFNFDNFNNILFDELSIDDGAILLNTLYSKRKEIFDQKEYKDVILNLIKKEFFYIMLLNDELIDKYKVEIINHLTSKKMIDNESSTNILYNIVNAKISTNNKNEYKKILSNNDLKKLLKKENNMYLNNSDSDSDYSYIKNMQTKIYKLNKNPLFNEAFKVCINNPKKFKAFENTLSTYTEDKPKIKIIRENKKYLIKYKF